MLKTLAVANYRSINKLVIPLDRLNLITGPNGSGKSNLYRALRLLAETAQGGVVNALAREGGLDSTFWAGPENISRRMRNGEVPVRYLLLVAALLTPRPPTLMVLNEPETSLHPDLLPALARLIIRASEQCQVWVVSHARRLISALQEDPECNCIVLEKNLGQTGIVGQKLLDEPAWYWPD
jgi:predicted ATPase